MKNRTTIHKTMIFAAFAIGCSAEEIRSWRDDNGITHYENIKREPSINAVSCEELRTIQKNAKEGTRVENPDASKGSSISIDEICKREKMQQRSDQTGG